MLLIFFLAFVTFISTLVGGSVAIRSRTYLPYIFAFASGALLAVALSDIMPESLMIFQSLSLPIRYSLVITIGSFIFYSFLERFFLTHHHEEDGHGHLMGPVGAGGLVIHSFLDGVAIAVSYTVNPSIGIIVALAVIFHDFTDGINTVTLMFKNKHSVKNARIFLLMDAIAPIAGVSLIFIFGTVSEVYLAIILSVFSGEFLYLGTTSLLPETYKHNWWKMTLLMICGAAIIVILTSIF